MKDPFDTYFELLRKWNERIRLVSACGDAAAFRQRHWEDCLAILPLLEGAQRMIDLGTGAGLPGIVIKVARPEIEVALLDSVRKKVAFCEEAIRRMGLSGVQAHCGRAEDVKIIDKLGVYDAVVSRATWSLAEFLPRALPFLATGTAGRIVAMKGPRWEEELEEACPLLATLQLKADPPLEYQLASGQRHYAISLRRS